MLKKLALLVALVCGVATAQNVPTGTTSLEPGQIYNTSNLVNFSPNPINNGTTSPWVNGIYQSSLTCWGPGGPGNCGPNPTVTPGSIHFSYGMTDLYQVTSVANALPNTGTGLNVNGFNFSFMAKNGNGWDNGQQDYLRAYVKFYGPDGNEMQKYDWDLNYKFNWTYFNLGKTFDTPYASKDLTAARYGFVGADSNLWAGPYGPEIASVNFSLKYSVDPCVTNPMFSPTCPGYLDALAKLIPSATTTSTIADPIAATSTSNSSTTTVVTDPVASTVSVSSATTIGQPSVVAPIVSAPSSTTTASSSSSSSSSTSQTSKESSSGSSNTSLALSIISKNSDRDAAGAAVAQAAVSQAQAAANQAQQEAQSVAANAVANSTTGNSASTNGQQSSGNGIRANNNNSNSTNFTLQSGQTNLATVMSGPQTSNNATTQQQSSGTSISIANSQSVVINVNTQQSTATTFALPLLQPQQPAFSAPVVSVFQTEQAPQIQTLTQSSNRTTQSTETYSIVPPNFLTDKSNPLTDIIEGKQNIPQSNTIANVGPSVNNNAKDNELAGGVDLNKMALAPTGYGDYLNFTMRDAAFYAPKEVYRNQRNVDNQRALRQLTNDSKHKDMVEMQYAR